MKLIKLCTWMFLFGLEFRNKSRVETFFFPSLMVSVVFPKFA